jgi:prolyl-tRNA synthetase
MKASLYLVPTTKDDPQDAVVASHKLMIRAGLIRKSSSGLYFYLPLGLRILKKVEEIVREEMNRSGALEFQMPILTPSEFWKESGRWDRMGKEMFRLKDRHENENCLGPTHEESFCHVMKPMLRSYKDLPVNVYQIHTKFRDEIRPRFGVIRSREFTMKDAYSFHLDDESLDSTYQLMRKTYRAIFQRMGLETIPVQADSGNMGGSASEEFMVVSPIGEETLMICSSCGYSGNIEKTPLLPNSGDHASGTKKGESVSESFAEPESSSGKSGGGSISGFTNFEFGEMIETPNVKTISDLAKFLNQDPADCIKAVALVVDSEPVLVFLPGDRELNEAKLKNVTLGNEIRPMGQKEMENLDLVAGYIGPDEVFHPKLKIFWDQSLNPNKEFIVGGNKEGFHRKGSVAGNLVNKFLIHDLSLTRSGDPCPNCGSPLQDEKGIEVGHIFKLGKKYTEAFDIRVLDKNGKSQLTTMGCYGIGVNRCVATIIEQCNDEKGIHWPISVAPFEVCMVSIAKAPEDIAKVSEIYEGLKGEGLDLFWDDRDLGPGFKFKDSELIGFPIRITIGKSFFESKEVSLLIRKTGEEKNIPFTGIQGLYDEIKAVRERLYSELGG